MNLPPVAVLPVSAEARLAYVLQHFWQAYEPARPVLIGYAADCPQVTVADGAGNFFGGRAPYPAAPNYREWQGQRVPFFFDAHPGQPLLERLPGRAVIHADVVAAAFYLLSGWQEYFSDERDQHGRFPYAASVQQRYGFVARPVVNYYFDVLRAAVEHVSGQELRPRRWAAGAPFATFVTHDIDNLHSAWKEPAKAALRRLDAYGFLRRFGRHLTRPDAWDNLRQVQQTVAEYGAVSTFFFLPEHRATHGTPNADYRLAAIAGQVTELRRSGAEIQLHGSLGTSTNAQKLRQNVAALERLNGKPSGMRFHYLSWEPRHTPALLRGFAYDTTLGFAEHFGFRHSYCHPFRLFNFETGQPFDFLEIPLNLMDATLHHPRYLRLAPAEIMPAIEPMLGEIERFGGVFTLLWHNENFDPANQVNGPREFHRIMEYLRGRGTTFLTGGQIVNERMRE